MSKRKLAGTVSLLLIGVSLISIFMQGLQLGLDFTGGVAIELGFEKPVDLEKTRTLLKADPIFAKAQVQNYGNKNTVLIKVIGIDSVDSAALGQSIKLLLDEDVVNSASSDAPNDDTKHAFELKRVDFIGPVVGDELRDQSGIAMLVAMFIMLFYVAVRFSSKFALGAILALFHDVIIVLGFFSISQIDFDLTVLAAILAVIGYSLNDTIVVSDRIRENFKAARLESPADIVNKSLSQTLGRTIITSLTTLFVLLALLIMGGEVIKGFSIALIVGVIVGTYSSIYVASNILMVTNITKQDFIEIVPEAVDDMP